MPRNVYAPVLPRGLLLVVALVLGGGVGVVEQRAAAAAIYRIVVDPGVCC